MSVPAWPFQHIVQISETWLYKFACEPSKKFLKLLQILTKQDLLGSRCLLAKNCKLAETVVTVNAVQGLWVWLGYLDPEDLCQICWAWVKVWQPAIQTNWQVGRNYSCVALLWAWERVLWVRLHWLPKIRLHRARGFVLPCERASCSLKLGWAWVLWAKSALGVGLSLVPHL